MHNSPTENPSGKQTTLGIYGQELPSPRNWQTMACKIKDKDWFNPHPELEQYCKKSGHNYTGYGEEYIVCTGCRAKCGAYIE